MKDLLKIAIRNAAFTGLYITAVAAFMNWAGQNKIGAGTMFLGPVAMLLLFVTSAGITSWFVFGQPAQMFLEGKKKDAITLLGYTLALLFALTLLVIASLIIFTR